MIDASALVQDVVSLVRTRSVSGDERLAVLSFVELLRHLGFDEVTTDALGNVIGIIRGARAGGRICFEGHIDTVSEGDVYLWNRDPFGGEVSDGRIWGRGTSDMKGALVAMAHGLASLLDERETLAGEIVLTAVVAEEIFEGVAFGHVLDALLPDVVVVGEATQLELAIGQKGRAEICIEVFGKSAHSSCPSAGVNAIKGFANLFSSIEELKLPIDPTLGPAILEPVDIISQPWPGASVIPSLCRSTWDRRLLPGERKSEVIASVQKTLDRECKRLPGVSARASLVEAEAETWTGKKLKAKRFFPAWLNQESSEIVTLARSALVASGLPDKVRTWGFCTDGSESAGQRGIPTIGFGPSREDLAHVADEYVAISELLAAAKGYGQLARALAGLFAD
jgi:putative selenium metabolism hydrolase